MFVAGHTIRIGTERGSGSCFSVETCREAVRRQIRMGADFIKVYATCSGGQPCSHQDAPAVFMKDELEAVVQTAKTRELKVAAHAHPTAGINLALEAGVDSIEHGSWLDETSYELLTHSNSYLVPTLMVRDLVQKRLDNDELTPERRARMERSQKEHPRRVAEGFKKGVMIVSGSDAGVVPDLCGPNVTFARIYIPRRVSVVADVKALIALWSLFRRNKFHLVQSITPKAGVLTMVAGWVAGVPRSGRLFSISKCHFSLREMTHQS